MAQDPVPPLPKPRSNAKGCIIGCLIVFVIGVAGVGIGTYTAYNAGMGALNSMTEKEPRELPEVVMTEEETKAASEKLKQFTEAIKSAESSQKTFTFTGQELNAILRSNDTTRALGESVVVTIKDGVVHGEVSLNLGDLLPIPFLQGRYANGSATFSISARDGRLFVFVEGFRMKGKEAPPEILEGLRTENLAKDAMNNPDFRELMKNVESVAVEGDQLVVTLK